jgi:hypothetical protein
MKPKSKTHLQNLPRSRKIMRPKRKMHCQRSVLLTPRTHEEMARLTGAHKNTAPAVAAAADVGDIAQPCRGLTENSITPAHTAAKADGTEVRDKGERGLVA